MTVIKIFAKQSVVGGKNDQCYTALIVGEGRKWMKVIWPNAAGIRIQKVSVDSRYTALDYPVARAKKHLRRMGKLFGITKSARKALRA